MILSIEVQPFCKIYRDSSWSLRWDTGGSAMGDALLNTITAYYLMEPSSFARNIGFFYAYVARQKLTVHSKDSIRKFLSSDLHYRLKYRICALRYYDFYVSR